MKRTSRVALATVAILMVWMAGCSKTYKPHPGAINTFDSAAYDWVLVAQDAIDSTKADLALGKFPPAIAAAVKTALNTGLIPAYNALYTAYTNYHKAAVEGTATASQATEVENAINSTSVQLANLTHAKTGGGQ
jgi:hypothetical protein